MELYKEHTAERVFQHLKSEFPDIPHPTDRTIRRWQKQRRLEEHFEQLVSVAKAMLGILDTVKFKGEDDYEIAPPNSLVFSLTRDEIISQLVDNISESRQEYGDSKLFDCFLVHLEAEEPSCRELDKYAESHPTELLELLKRLVLEKEFKGKCSIC